MREAGTIWEVLTKTNVTNRSLFIQEHVCWPTHDTAVSGHDISEYKENIFRQCRDHLILNAVHVQVNQSGI